MSIFKTALDAESRMPFEGFPKIGQFRHVVGNMKHISEYIGQDAAGNPQYDESRIKPTLTFNGTTKLHGTNAGIAFNLVTQEWYAQSKERQLHLNDDNSGFCAWVLWPARREVFEQLQEATKKAAIALKPGTVIALRIFGEWCGQGVNAKTAIGKLATKWVIFNAKATYADDSQVWVPANDIKACLDKALVEPNLHFVTDYQQWSISIDFNHPEQVLDELERITLEVEQECPVAKALGESGLGEGVVWTCTTTDTDYGRQWFKTKGTKHKGTKSARLVEVAPEVLESIDAFVSAVLTNSRLEQGLALLYAQHGTKLYLDHMGDFLKWIGNDILTEEADTLKASGLTRKQVSGNISRRAKAWLQPFLSQV